MIYPLLIVILAPILIVIDLLLLLALLVLFRVPLAQTYPFALAQVTLILQDLPFDQILLIDLTLLPNLENQVLRVDTPTPLAPFQILHAITLIHLAPTLLPLVPNQAILEIVQIVTLVTIVLQDLPHSPNPLHLSTLFIFPLTLLDIAIMILPTSPLPYFLPRSHLLCNYLFPPLILKLLLSLSLLTLNLNRFP